MSPPRYLPAVEDSGHVIAANSNGASDPGIKIFDASGTYLRGANLSWANVNVYGIAITHDGLVAINHAYQNNIDYPPHMGDLLLDPGENYATEVARGQAPQVADVFSPGNISRRRSSVIFASTTGHLSLRTTSNPPSILLEQQYHPPGFFVTVADRAGHTYANFKFSWWDRNGIRQEDALGGLNFTINPPGPSM